MRSQALAGQYVADMTLDNSPDEGTQPHPRLAVFPAAHSRGHRSVRLDDLIAGMVHEIRSLAPARISVEIGNLAPAAAQEIALPPAQAEDLVRHLVIEALDAMPAEGTLSIFVETTTTGLAHDAVHRDLPPGSYVMLSVCDTGNPMPAANVPRLAVLPTAASPSLLEKGRALGLSAAAEAIQAAGGCLSLAHQNEKTVVRVIFPAVG